MLFILGFQVEITVHAKSEVVDVQQAKTISLPVGSIEASRGTLLKEDPAGWKLLSGDIFLLPSEHQQMGIQSLFGDVESAGEVNLVVNVEEKQLIVRAISGQVVISLRDGRRLLLQKGLQLSVGPVQSSGQNFMTLPEPIAVLDYARSLALRPNMSREKLKEILAIQSQSWKNAGIVSGDLYQQVVQRHLASVQDEINQKEKRRQIEEQQRKRFRQMLQDKAFHQ